MFKHIIRMILPLVVLVLIALCLALSPVLATHAAAPPGVVIHTVSSQLALLIRFLASLIDELKITNMKHPEFGNIVSVVSLQRG